MVHIKKKKSWGEKKKVQENTCSVALWVWIASTGQRKTQKWGLGNISSLKSLLKTSEDVIREEKTACLNFYPNRKSVLWESQGNQDYAGSGFGKLTQL